MSMISFSVKRSEVKGLSNCDFPLLRWRIVTAIFVIPVDIPSFFHDQTFQNVNTRNWNRDRFQLVKVFVDGARYLS